MRPDSDFDDMVVGNHADARKIESVGAAVQRLEVRRRGRTAPVLKI